MSHNLWVMRSQFYTSMAFFAAWMTKEASSGIEFNFSGFNNWGTLNFVSRITSLNLFTDSSHRTGFEIPSRRLKKINSQPTWKSIIFSTEFQTQLFQTKKSSVGFYVLLLLAQFQMEPPKGPPNVWISYDTRPNSKRFVKTHVKKIYIRLNFKRNSSVWRCISTCKLLQLDVNFSSNSVQVEADLQTEELRLKFSRKQFFCICYCTTPEPVLDPD